MHVFVKNGWFPRQRRWQLVFGGVSVLALVGLLGVFTFILDVKDTRFVTENQMGVEHNCLTAYACAAHFASQKSESLYDSLHYRDSSPSNSPVHEAVFGTFYVDQYMYAPQFLILPYGVWLVSGDFFTMRIVWFLLTLMLFTGALLLVARWCGAFRERPLLLLFPLLLLAPTVHITLQIGNVHLMIIAISMLAMLAIEQRHPLLGGAVLGYAVLAKMWPAVLVVYLIARRRWKAVLYCGGAMVIYTGVAWLLFGWSAYTDFFQRMLPDLMDGQAFNWMINRQPALVENMSIFSFWHKMYGLQMVADKPPLVSPSISLIMLVFVLASAVVIGLQRHNLNADSDGERISEVVIWLALMTLMQLRSPFLPWVYGVISTLCLLLFVGVRAKGATRIGLAVLWCLLAVQIPLPFLQQQKDYNLHYTFVVSFLVLGVLLWVVIPHFIAAGRGMLNRLPAKEDSAQRI